MPTTLTNGIQLPDKGSVDWYSSMQSNYNLIDTHLGDTDVHVTAEDKANWNSKQGSLSQAQLDAIAQVATNTSDITALQSGKANASHTHSSSDITDIGDYATKQYVDNSISGLVDNAPDALNTLNELSAALNDDSNFASTVTTALAAKADSADLATVATSGSYTDLTDKPTINDSTITIQKNGSTVDTFTTNGSNKTINIPVPTKTSDLTNDSNFVVSSSLATVATSGFYNDLDNKPYIPDKISDLIDDSNFVDTSNPAVASGITSAKVTDYDTHIADTDIHVTTADKNKWNNQTYVFRYSSTALTASSTNSNALLDNTDNLKVGDKVIDSSGVLFSITAIDTANSTFTIGTALIDLAQDSDVVHKSGDETVGGKKTFTATPYIYNSDSTENAPNILFRNSKYSVGDTTDTGEQRIIYADKNGAWTGSIASSKNLAGTQYLTFTVYSTDNNNANISSTINYYLAKNGDRYFTPYEDNLISLGSTTRRWKAVCAINYYYGSNNVEFSTKFVTTDTAQTISGNKTFNGNTNCVGEFNQTAPFKMTSDTSFATGSKNTTIYDQDGFQCSNEQIIYNNSKNIRRSWIVNNNGSGTTVSAGFNLILSASGGKVFYPISDSDTDNGTSSAYWKNTYTKKINNLEPSSLSLPSDRSARIDISSYFTDTSNGGVNRYTAPSNGFVYLAVTDVVTIHLFSQDSGRITNYGDTRGRASAGQLYAFLPVRKGDVFTSQWYTTLTNVSLTSAYFIPCLGNV